jgi:hypothetical protein
VTTVTETARYGAAAISAWGRLHPRQGGPGPPFAPCLVTTGWPGHGCLLQAVTRFSIAQDSAATVR